MRRLVPLLLTLLLSATGAAVTSSAHAQLGRAASAGVRHVAVPPAGRAVDTSHPDHVIGNGTPGSCTSAKVVRTVARGGVITFRCGQKPVVIAMQATAKVVNTSHRVVIDGGNKVTLDGKGVRRILYQNTCDQKQVWATDHCTDQAFPHLVVQNLTLAHGKNTQTSYEFGGGGAIFDRGGQLKVVHTKFVGNRCAAVGPDVGGAGIRALEQYRGRPVYVVGSVFRGGRCSNGSGISSIGVSWQVLNSRFTHNQAIGHGANPARPGTPGGGSGGAAYFDGNLFRVSFAGTLMRDNHANEGGGAVFFVSNDRTGHLGFRWSTLTDNVSAGFQNYPGIFFLGSGSPTFDHSVVR